MFSCSNADYVEVPWSHSNRATTASNCRDRVLNETIAGERTHLRQIAQVLVVFCLIPVFPLRWPYLPPNKDLPLSGKVLHVHSACDRRSVQYGFCRRLRDDKNHIYYVINLA